ncbi:MAG: sodium:calcium antiporter [Thermotogaceae bacterium]|nr:sodium:calcium antiporter [Thermotogaceae bacterium]
MKLYLTFLVAALALIFVKSAVPMTLFPFISIVFGFYILIKGADVLVEGAVAIAERAGVSKLFIGLSLVAIGTSAPELAVSLASAVKGYGGIAVSDIVGSNIANISFCLGFTLLFGALSMKSTTKKVEIPFLVLVSLSFFAMLLREEPATIVWNDGIVLLSIFVIFVYYLINMAKSDMEELEKEENIDIKKAVFMAGAGLVGVIFGGDITVDSIVEIADMFHLSNSLFALTVVAVGTSLPELVTSVTAANKGHTDLSVGNIVGSNVMNILLIIGVSSIAGKRLVVDVGMYWVDATFLLLTSVILAMMALKGKLRRYDGIILLIIYISYISFVIWRR